MTFAKYARYTLLGVMAISLAFILWFYIGEEVNPDSAKPEPVATGPILRYAYLLAIVSIVAVIIFSIFNIIGNPKSIKSFAIVLVIAAILVVFARLLASDEVLNMISYTGEENVPGVLKNVGTGLNLTYFLLGGSALLIIYSEISKLFR